MADLFALGVGLLVAWMTVVLMQLREAWCPKCCCCCSDCDDAPEYKNQFELSPMSPVTPQLNEND